MLNASASHHLPERRVLFINFTAVFDLVTRGRRHGFHFRIDRLENLGARSCPTWEGRNRKRPTPFLLTIRVICQLRLQFGHGAKRHALSVILEVM